MKLKGSHDLGHRQRFEPSGFFALRTPLLPFDELLGWSEGLDAPAPLGDPAQLSEVLARDRLLLRDRLYAIFSHPAAREALFIAAPDLEEFFDIWVHEPDSKRGQRIELALVRYFLRMAGRATPFGLFAGCSVGSIADETRLVIDGQEKCRRHTRLDMDYLSVLAEELGREPALKKTLIYYPNSSLYRISRRVRYVESRFKDKRRTYHLVSVEDTDALSTTLALAQEGARPDQLASELVGEDISQAEAEAYILELIDNQVLVPDLALPGSGPEPIHSLIELLSENGSTTRIAAILSETRAATTEIDASGVGVPPARYRDLAKALEELPAPVELPRLFQVDLVKSAPGAMLGSTVLAEIVQGVEVLHRLFGSPRMDDLTRFRDAFTERYEQQEVPLVEALDEEVGIGFPPGGTASKEATPLLNGLALPGAPAETVKWGTLDTLLLDKLAEALANQAQEISLEFPDLKAISPKELLPLPDAFAVTASVAGTDDAAISRGDFRVFLRAVSGPSGAYLLGRFCHADGWMCQQVESHLRAEEALQPDAVFAEVVHLPEGRVGNILLRPLLRDYEIPYLGRSGAAVGKQIPVTDLRVSVRNGRVCLRSVRLGRQVIPRLTSAHAFHQSSSGVYKFLGSLQTQEVAFALGWDWGALWSAPFLPRVAMGRLVLSLARWRVSKEEIKLLSTGDEATRFQSVQKWRAERKLPRWILLADGDNALPVDLDNFLCTEAFIHLIRQRIGVVVTELFPDPDQLCVRGPEGRFVHELVIPFVRKKEESHKGKDEGRRMKSETEIDFVSNPSSSALHPSSFITRRFPPGSEWLYAKLYVGTSIADQVLRDIVRPLTEELLQSGAVESWFFIRYGDPDWHLRLRLHGVPERLHSEALPALQAAAALLLEDGRLWRMQLDTYEREVERYGGEEGVQLAERLFHIDSEAVLDIMELLETGDTGLDERWRLTLRGMHMILDDLGLDLGARHSLLNRIRKAFAMEFRADEHLIGQLGDRFRKERRDLELLLDSAQDSESPLWPGIEILQRRSEQWASTIMELKAGAQAGRLSLPLAELASSYLHMHANRLLRSAQRGQEMVIYDYLARLYESQLARGVGSRSRVFH